MNKFIDEHFEEIYGKEINMKSNDKTVLISGMMFNVTFFLSMMMSVFITNAVAIAIVASTVTFLFSTDVNTKRLIPIDEHFEEIYGKGDKYEIKR